MLRIWGRENSSNVKKVLWCAEELELAYERIPAGGKHGVVDEPAYRALNPNGLVPTIEDDGLVLWESNAIVRYLAARYGEGVLWQADPIRRAGADRWMDFSNSSLAAPYRDLMVNLVRSPPEKRDMAVVEAAVARMGQMLGHVDAALAGQPYLSGESVGIGDIPAGTLAQAWFALPIERPELPHLAAWFARLSERPAYRKAVLIPLT